MPNRGSNVAKGLRDSPVVGLIKPVWNAQEHEARGLDVEKLQVRVLGSPTMLLDGKPVTGWTSNKVTALAFYLVVTRRPHPREALIERLWESVPVPQAQQSLRGALFVLRKLLEPFLAINRQTVGLASDALVDLDLATFEYEIAAARTAAPDDARAHLERAVALYAGDFLDGLWVTQAPAFEEWLASERERVRQLMLSALHDLATDAIRRGALGQVIDYATRVLKMDPWQEEAHRHLMYGLAISGQRGNALAQYDICRRALQDELGVDPSDETTDLYRRILDGEIATPIAERVALPSRPLHNLPAPMTQFVGRDADCATIVATLRDPTQRLVTLTGPGGIGKTRLALEVAQALVPTTQQPLPFGQGVFLVSLAAAAPREPIDDVLATAIATDVQIPLSGSDAPSSQVLHFLREKALLLVLDNFEHVVAGASFVARLLREAPQVKVLATSRVRLHLRGERVIELEGLPFPATSVAPEEIEQHAYDAVQLFVQTAQSVSPSFEFTPACAVAIARICRMVDGLPLGVELAATWTHVLDCDEIADEIARSMDFLASGTQDMPERHQSLRAVFTYSWNLLSPPEQEALRRLALFQAPFTREAANEVAGASLPLLASLIDKSLLQRDAVAMGGTRYELLQVLREFAADQLEVAGETADVARRYVAYYLGWLGRHAAALRGADQRAVLTTIVADIEHIRAAWDWAIEQQAVAALVVAAPSLFHVYDMRSWFGEGATMFGRARRMLETLPSSVETQVALGMVVAREGWFVFHLGDQVTARTFLDRSIHLLRSSGARAELVFALNYQGAVCSYLGEYAMTEALCAECIAICEAEGDEYGRAVASNILAQAAYARHDDASARRWSEQSLRIEQRLGNRWSMAYSLTNLGNVAYRAGDYALARPLFEQALAIREEMQDTRGIATSLNRLGDIAIGMDDRAEARRCYEASLALCREIGNRWGIAAASINLGVLAADEHDDREAVGRLQEALRFAVETASLPQLMTLFAAFVPLLRRNGEHDWAATIAPLGERIGEVAQYLAASAPLLGWKPHRA